MFQSFESAFLFKWQAIKCIAACKSRIVFNDDDVGQCNEIQNNVADVEMQRQPRF